MDACLMTAKEVPLIRQHCSRCSHHENQLRKTNENNRVSCLLPTRYEMPATLGPGIAAESI
jgi:hypothetical protein